MSGVDEGMDEVSIQAKVTLEKDGHVQGASGGPYLSSTSLNKSAFAFFFFLELTLIKIY